MRRQSLPVCTILALSMVWSSGCRPQQPHYLFEDGDLSHYVGEATQIEFADSRVESLDEVTVDAQQNRPLTLQFPEAARMWNLTLEEAVQNALANSKVMRTLGGQVVSAPETLSRSPDLAPTVYDPALMETDPRGGPEAALAAFDAQLHSTAGWTKTDTPLNYPRVADPVFGSLFPAISGADTGVFMAEIYKTNATGGRTALRQNVGYDWSNRTLKQWPSDWTTSLEAEFRQPLLQGAGVQFNRIAGPSASPGLYNGVILARLNTDIRLADFEASVRNLVMDVERTYWELYLAYRELDTARKGRDSMLELWRVTSTMFEHGAADIADETQIREQYFQFHALVQDALNRLYTVENNLRYMMGISATDGRLIRPADEPTTAPINFPWSEVHYEALARSVDLRRQRWKVKSREMELIAAKNFLLPRLDAVARYRWLGMGSDLINSTGGPGPDVTPAGEASRYSAFQDLTSGRYQEWELGLEFTLPIGFRREMAGVRHAQLAVARERALLQDEELEVSHQVAQAIRSLEGGYELTKTGFSRLQSAKHNTEALQTRLDAGSEVGGGQARSVRTMLVSLVLDSKRRLADAEANYHRALVAYNEAIAMVHYRKGSLLEYNGVYLAEGPWPAKAYFDATRLARERDAAIYMDYGYTRPKVLSRGPYEQEQGTTKGAELKPAQVPNDSAGGVLEPIPAGEATPIDGSQAPTSSHRPASGAAAMPFTMQGRGPAHTAGVAMAEGPAAPKPARPAVELASGLGALAGKAGKGTPAAEGQGLVQPVSYERPVSAALGGSWTARRSSSNSMSIPHEPVENLPSGQADQSSSGWKAAQH
jgi:outer membrane protein TolC